jgi:hypothetical protein
LLTTAVKHSHIDRSRSAAERAQRHLQRFARELRDVGEHQQGLSAQIGGFDKFADYFFDGLIFDWIVQSKIVRSQEEVQTTTANVREIVRRLERRRNELLTAQQELEAERLRLLTDSN